MAYESLSVYVNNADADAAIAVPVLVHKIVVEHADGTGALSVTLNNNATRAGAATCVVDVGGAKSGASATGLANDATAYTATAIIDGVTRAISVTGSAAQTYTNLLTELNTDCTGGTWTISGGNLLLTSSTTTASSNLVVTDTTLFAALTGFKVICAPKRPALPKCSCTTRQVFASNFQRMAQVDFDPPVPFTNVSAEQTGTGYYRVYYTRA